MTPKKKSQADHTVHSTLMLNERNSTLVSNLADSNNLNLILGLQTAIDQTGSYIFTKDLGGRYTYVNLKVQELFGAKFDDIIGKDDSHFFDLDISNEIRLNDRRVLDFDETIEQEESNVIKSTGEKRIYWTVKKTIKNSDGQIIGMCGVSTDITELKRSEDILRENSQELRESQFIAGLGTYILDVSAGTWESSPVLDEIFGIDEKYQRTVDGWESIIYIDDREMMHDYFLSAVIGNRIGFDKKYRIVRLKDNVVRWVHGIGKLDLDEAGLPTKMHGTIQDITEQKLAEIALRESENRFSIMLNNELVGIATVKDRVFQWVNPAYERMLGYSKGELTGVSARVIYPNEEAYQAMGKLYLPIISSGNSLHMEYELLRKDGRLITVDLFGSALYSGSSESLWIYNDITERKQAESTLRDKEYILSESQRIGHIGSWHYELSGKRSWSDETYRIYGVTPESFNPSEEALIELIHPEDRKVMQDWLTACIGGQSPDGLDFRIIRPDGQLRILRGIGELQYDAISQNPKNLIGIVQDITELKLAETALKESEFRYQLIFDMNPLPIWIIDESTLAFLMVNNFAVEHYGYSREEFSKMTLRDIRPKEDIAELDRTVTNYPDRRTIGEKRHLKKDGTIIFVIINTVPIIFGNKHARLAIIQDITERKRVEKSLNITASVFDISQEAIAITDADNNIIDVNPAFTKITGFSKEEVIGKNPHFLSSGRHGQEFYEKMWKSLKEDGLWRGEIWNRRKSGEVYPEMLSISVLKDMTGKVLTHVAVFSDISNLKQHEEELVRVAHFDALTSIPNRILLADRMKQAISQTSRDKNLMAVCYLDLDGFKPINDMLGHQVGDDVLIEIARRIGITIRGGDTVARLGGDEFVVLLLGLNKGEECITTLVRLLEAIATPIDVNSKTVAVTASIGVSLYSQDENDPDTLLRHADQAMYIAKQSGKNRFHIFDVKLDQRTRDQNDFLKSLRIALEQNQFELHYQPKVNLRTKKLFGAEALIRWRHPVKGLLSPGEFLRQVDNTDLDILIGEWVTATSLAQIYQWQRMGLDIEVSINISGYHLESKDFVSKLQQQLAIYPDLPFGKLQIEVLETVALNDISVVKEIIESCSKIGVGFALDDFGTGYSSLSYLSALPVDTLKIDQSFVRDMLEDKGDKAIVQGIIALAKAFGLLTVAEGIETHEHYEVLLEMGCEIGQGYGIARPMPAIEFINWAQRQP